MRKMDYIQGNSDHTLFVKKEGDKVCILLVYVDDMIITSDHHEKIIGLKKRLKRV